MKRAIVAYAFGVPFYLPSNRLLAEIVGREMAGGCVAAYTQRDINLSGSGFEEYTEEVSGKPPPTLRIARGAVRWAKENEVTHLVVVAAGPHMWRALRDTQAAAREIGLEIDIRQSREVAEFEEDSWFCPESEQSRVRTPKDWNGRERLLCHMPFWLYKLVAA